MNEDLARISLAILRRWWVVLIVSIIIIGTINWRVASSPTSYQSTSLFAITPNQELAQDDLLRALGLLNNDTVSATFADVLSSPDTLNNAFASLESAPSNIGQYDLTATVEPQSNVIRITIEGPSENTVGMLYQAIRPIVEALVVDIYEVFQVRFLTPVSNEVESVGPPMTFAIVVSVIIGVGVGSLLALWLDSILHHRRIQHEVDRALFDETEPSRTIAVPRQRNV